MNLTIYDQFEQDTPLWFLARLGLPTASNFKTVMAKGTKDERSKTRERYIDELVAELMTNVPNKSYVNQYMKDGAEMEEDALDAYVAKTGHSINKVAFIRNHDLGAGCSPDGLIGQEGGVEAKTMIPPLMVQLLCAPGVPSQYLAQIHGNLLVTGRQWWDIVIYCPHFKPYIERIHRETGWADEIRRYLDAFNVDLKARVFKATQEEHTWISLRKQCDRFIEERIEEEMPSADLLPWPVPRPEPASITEQLRASLAMEDE